MVQTGAMNTVGKTLKHWETKLNNLDRSLKLLISANVLFPYLYYFGITLPAKQLLIDDVPAVMQIMEYGYLSVVSFMLFPLTLIANCVGFLLAQSYRKAFILMFWLNIASYFTLGGPALSVSVIQWNSWYFLPQHIAYMDATFWGLWDLVVGNPPPF